MTKSTVEWCVARNHPLVTYNQTLNMTFCRCGLKRYADEQPLDWEAKRSIFHDHPADSPCRCYAEGKPS